MTPQLQKPDPPGVPVRCRFLQLVFVFAVPLLPLIWLIGAEATYLPKPTFLFSGAFASHGSMIPQLLLFLSGGYFLATGMLLFGNRYDVALLLGACGVAGATASVWCLQLLWTAAEQPYSFGSRSGVGALLQLIQAGYTQLNEGLPLQNRAFGYTAGVGMAEELAKVTPILLLGLTPLTSKVRLIAAFSVGAGFGLAESILYSEQYAGREPAIVYFARYFSLVALHAMWTTMAYGFVSMVIASPRCRAALRVRSEWTYVGLLLLGLLPAVVTHGIFDAVVSSSAARFAIPVVGITVALAAFIVHRRRDAIASLALVTT